MSSRITNAAVLALSALLPVGCGDGSPTTSSSPTATVPGTPSTALSSPVRPAADNSSDAIPTTVSQILANPGAFLGKEVQLEGNVTEQLEKDRFQFTDGTGQIPMDFSSASPPPPLNMPLRVVGRVAGGDGGAGARIDVTSWVVASEFNCEMMQDAAARFSEPGFALGDVVGLFLKYEGVPPGEKILEITWDEGNPSGVVERVPVGQGEPRDDNLYDLEGVATHQYTGVTGTEDKKVRATLSILGVEGQCSRVRDVTVSSGSGPGTAGGGTLRVSVEDPVKSGSWFEVRATVQNLVSVPINIDLIFQTPTDCEFDSATLPPGCTKLSRDVAECVIEGLQPEDGLSKVISYVAPTVTSPREISGSVTLAVSGFAPVATYTTTVKP